MVAALLLVLAIVEVCVALAKPKTTKMEPPGRTRGASYLFVSTRPAEKVKNEVSVIIGYPFKSSSDATAEIGTTKFAMYTQNDGAWIKNVAEEARAWSMPCARAPT